MKSWKGGRIEEMSVYMGGLKSTVDGRWEGMRKGRIGEDGLIIIQAKEVEI